ncbi:transcription elongation GreA/GreB family factor [Clostridium tetanomorphum]|uniref:Transcription elongation factor GreA/GreB N-terminal domain-containing protein n=1 Tax=Clostridium tetanomorphum TaxID=1553 RepID=A0A923IYR9_CLOTT|nr:hypothetical protein [Clostridium tetanomorphum]KAJ50250.1 hypothetical protein CTM_19389 [Clostridium tetanomorphum DSM 665]MBC2396192.1 hypothetical protein [Clostridium tetanomorphum]MBP1864391.1 transcription elongation GreA/GreB family factor [Clostridium tetanomorphum]NRS83837.1 transcription elongation GreA/GreB family factor [Clostridium tetanomorphum]NRZ97024.1 transcription elongation GreA/GreB family factor [Clostridium tetanomorphum]
MKKIRITHEKLAKLAKEVQYLKTVRRMKIAEKIKDVLINGDLNFYENLEYISAKKSKQK